MSDAGMRNVFGLAITVANIRLGTINRTNLRNATSRAMAYGFGMTEDDGDDVFHNLESNEEVYQTLGFEAGSVYASREQSMYYILDDFLPNVPTTEKEILNLVAHSIIFGVSVAGGVQISSIRKIMGWVLFNTAVTANQHQVFLSDDKGITKHPFSDDVISNLIKQNYTSTIVSLNASPKNQEVSLNNYNWFDMSQVFHGPDTQIVKDIENQYYYLSGQLQYESLIGDVADCIEDSVTLKTSLGRTLNFNYVRNLPCKDPNTYIGPVDNVKFYRKFNDGPPSSGDFTEETKDAYMEFDRQILETGDWNSNVHYLDSFYSDANNNAIPLCTTTVHTSINGRIGLPQEYTAVPASYDCVGWQNMHIGDNVPRKQCTKNDECIGCSEVNKTGWKFAPLEVTADFIEQNKYVSFITNPSCSTGDLVQRVLDFNSGRYSPYKGTLVGNELNTYTINSSNQQQWYFGPPQYNGRSLLPALAFFQSFSNNTFGTPASVVIYPAQTLSQGISIIGDSYRVNTISKYALATGKDKRSYPYYSSNKPRAKFVTTIHTSELDSRDDISKRFFGMGNSMDNIYTIQAAPLENAGFLYTGFAMSLNGDLINPKSILDNYSPYLIGNAVKTIKFISGYSVNRQNIGMNQRFAKEKDNSGNLHGIYYINNDNLSTPLKTQDTGWSSFSPLPDTLDGNYSRILVSQPAENYLPRYFKGPYSVENRKFLYPNASLANRLYVGKSHGFPTKISFQLDVREEAVKELFGTYTITNAGIITSNPTYKAVVRPDAKGNTEYGMEASTMYKIFQPTQNSRAYDFNNWKIGEDFAYYMGLEAVDNNYSPAAREGSIPSGRNNIIYNETKLNIVDQYFSHGFARTGWNYTEHYYFTGSEYEQGFPYYSISPMPLGLYHRYQTLSKDVEFQYVRPIFNISSGGLYVNTEMQSVFQNFYAYRGTPVEDMSDARFLIKTGTDPFFFEYIGGRKGELSTSGNLSATGQGGYHSHGIVGDAWMAFVQNSSYDGIQTYDKRPHPPCSTDLMIRNPNYDDRMFLFNSTPTGTTIWTRSLALNPLIYPQSSYRPFKASDTIYYTLEGGEPTVLTTNLINNECLEFDLSLLLPLVKIKNAGPQWYSRSGIKIGPFDRDIELGIIEPNRIATYTDLYVNHNQITQLYENNGCNYDILKDNISVTTGLLNDDTTVRRRGYSIISTSPSGAYLYLNVYSNPKIGGDGTIPAGHIAESQMGIPSGKLVIKAHKKLDGEIFHTYLHSGEESWINRHNFVNNGLEQSFVIPHEDGFGGLLGTHTFLTSSRSGKYYPVPGQDFTGLGKSDQFGNIIYPNSATVENYWTHYCLLNDKTMKISGWREGSRLSFTIKNLQIEYEAIPYELYNLVIPSGRCTISGEMGYLGQADQTVFTEGVYLTNTTSDDDLISLYNPSFVSPVLSRLLTYGLWTWPTGSGLSPLLEAPSLFQQRTPDLLLTETPTFSGILSESPTNYNKLLWPALSDLETLNPGETIEAIPPDDGNTFTNSTMMFSASRGQPLANGENNPNIEKNYTVQAQFQMYDSVATNAMANSGVCLTSKHGTKVVLNSSCLSTVLAPEGTPLVFVNKGLV